MEEIDKALEPANLSVLECLEILQPKVHLVNSPPILSLELCADRNCVMAEIVAFRDAYPHYLFAITPECGGDCQDGNFGVKSLSSRPGFLHGNDVAKSQLPNAIITSLGGIIDEFDAMKYMEVNYEAPRIQAEVMRATMPIARVVFFCPPCVTAITTAVNICKSQENAITEWRVRVEYVLFAKYQHHSNLP